MGEKTREKIFPETHVYRDLKTMEKKSSGKVRKHVYYKHMKVVTLNGGKKREKKIFLETHLYREQKTKEKNRLEKVRKYVFHKHTNIVTKKREKSEKILFPETHEYRVKTMEKNRLEKVRKHVFYKQMNIITKNSEEKNATKNFSKNTRIGYHKNVGKKSSQKVRNTFFINT